MKLTNTKRALMGAAAVLILGAVITYRNGGRAFTQQDYMLIGAAVVLVVMNIIGSYYFDRKADQEGLKGKKK
jgi:drug/metabolite transporter (DMT)-like permease